MDNVYRVTLTNDISPYEGFVSIPANMIMGEIQIEIDVPENGPITELSLENSSYQCAQRDNSWFVTLGAGDKPKSISLVGKTRYQETLFEFSLNIELIVYDLSTFYAINLQDSARKTLYFFEDEQEYRSETITKNNPICLGIETDNQANGFIFVFGNVSDVKNCQCIVSLEAANGNKSMQEIKQTDCFNEAFNTNNTIKEDVTEIILNWKPNNFLMQEKGLVKFAFQFYRLNKNGEYDFVLNTAPIYGYVHEGLNVIQGIGSNIYPSEIADLYSKYNSLLSDEDITDLDSFEDVKLYLQTLVPFNIGADSPTTEAPDNSKKTWYILAYNPGQKRYGYVPAAMLDKEVIHGQVWNVGDYTGIQLENLPQKDPELN